jgi:hypothetical protein
MPLFAKHLTHRRPGLVARVGVLRIAVASIAIAFLPFVFFSGERESVLGVIATQVVPGLALFMIWALPFDMLMARVFMVDKHGPERDRYKTVITLDIVLLVALLVFWGPFFFSLLTQ